MIYYTKTKEVKVPYTSYSTCTESYTKEYPTKVKTSKVEKSPSPSTKCETKVKTKTKEEDKTKTICTTKKAGGYGY